MRFFESFLGRFIAQIIDKVLRMIEVKIERTKNASRNIAFGIILKIYQIAVPFLMRTAMIYFMGVQYLGLNSLFTSILQVLNLTELGVGSAMVYSMYKPIAEDDEATICALIRLYKLYYRIIGLVIATAGTILTPFVPYLIKSDFPAELNVYILYLMNLAITVLSYWLFAYKNSLLQAHQRTDITSKVTLLTNTVQYALQFLVLITVKDYYIFVLVNLATQALTNIATAYIATKMYPNYKPEGKLPKQDIKKINHRIRDLFTAKLGGTIVNSADTIVISAFLGLSMLAVYQNYYYIMNSVVGFILVIFNSCTAGIGNSLVVETEEKNYTDFKKLVFLTMWISTVCISCFTCLYQPFMAFWVGKEYLLDMKVVILLCVYFYLYLLNHLSCVYKDAGGIWHEDRFRPLTGGLVNLVLNLILVQYIGIYGIILSTIFSYLFVAMPWLIHNLFKLVFKRSFMEYVGMLFKGAVISFAAALISYLICGLLNIHGIWELVVNTVISVCISILILILIYKKDPMYLPFLELCDRVTNYKFHKIIEIIK